MGMFTRDKHRRIPGLNTASLPDLIFTMLFFFMIVTNMRESSPHEPLDLPQGENLEHVQKETSEHYIYIGMKDGDCFVQLDEEIILKDALQEQLSARLHRLSSGSASRPAISLGVDERVEMGLVEEVKRILRQSNISTVNYLGKEAP